MPTIATIRGIDVLVICTGNQCRSPMAEALFRDRLARRGLHAGVTSAGLVSEGVPASGGSVRAMDKRGLDIGAHRSHLLTEDDVALADLVVGMTREHVREAVVMVPAAFERSFTLRELVRRAEDADAPAVTEGSGGEEIRAWLGLVGADRRAVDLIGDSPDDDVEDPMGRSRRFYERTAVELEDLVDRFMAVAYPVPLPADSL